jgi:hypothetical protein
MRMSRVRKQLAGLAIGLTVALGLTATVWATVTFTDPATGMTITYPGVANTVLYSCEPWETEGMATFTVGNVPANSTVVVRITTFNGEAILNVTQQTSTGVGGTLVFPFPYPQDTSLWPTYNAVTNERNIGFAALVDVKNPAGVLLARLRVPKFSVRCLPPAKPAGGCTPGYWRQFGGEQGGDQHLQSWLDAGFNPSDDFESVFNVDATFSPHTLGDAVWLGGGGENALARHAVAALLNAHALSFQYSVTEVLAMVQQIYSTAPNSNSEWNEVKDLLDRANNAGCPLN